MIRATVTARTPHELAGLVMGLGLASLAQMRSPRTRARIPPLYTSGIRYRRESPTSEHWQLALETAELGYGDCEDLCGYRVAELWNAGEDAAHIRVVPIHAALLHVVVVRADGTIEDPSRRLGMGRDGQ